MQINLLEREATIWEVQSSNETIGGLKYLGDSKWHFKDAAGDHKFDAANVDEAKTQIKNLISSRTTSEEAGSKVVVDMGDFRGFIRYNLKGLQGLAGMFESAGAYTVEATSHLAETIAAIDNDTERVEARNKLVELLDSYIERHKTRRQHAMKLSEIVGQFLQGLVENSEAGNDDDEATKAKAH